VTSAQRRWFRERGGDESAEGGSVHDEKQRTEKKALENTVQEEV